MRPSKEEYYLNIAQDVASRATCLRRKYGAIIVKEDQIIATGYCGAPRGVKDCLEKKYCHREKLNVPSGERYELCRSAHAEMNAIINAARAGVSVLGGNIYIAGIEAKTGKLAESHPCLLCQRIIINAGLKNLIIKTKNNKIKTITIKKLAKKQE